MIVFRFPLYFPSYDDLSLHLILGGYTQSIWEIGKNLPMGIFTFSFPLWHMFVSLVINILGIRLANLVMFVLLMSWAYRLYGQFVRYFGSSYRSLLKIVWVVIFFYPPLSATYFSFMTDLVALLLALQAAYYAICEQDGYVNWAINYLLLGLAIKPASLMFAALPLLAMITRRYKEIKLLYILPVVAILTWFHVKVWMLTGNPTPGLLNTFFKSPLYPLSNFKDTRWGAINIWQSVSWPISAIWTGRYDELRPRSYVKLLTMLLPGIAYIVSIIGSFKRERSSVLILASFGMWILISGYSRYAIPLCAVALVYQLKSINIHFKVPHIATLLIPLVVLLVVKNDFAWRPYPSFKNPESTKYFWTSYRQGLQLIGKDMPKEMAKANAEFFGSYNNILLDGRGMTSYVGYLGYLNGVSPKEYHAGEEIVGKALLVTEHEVPENCQKIESQLNLVGLQNIEGSAKMAVCISNNFPI